MTNAIGEAGRRARRMAFEHRRATTKIPGPGPAPYPVLTRPLTLLQRAVGSPPPEEEPANSNAPGEAPTVETTDRETRSPTAEQIAEQVYRLMSQDLRRDRERCGHW